MSERTYDSIIIAGERYKLTGAVRCVTWKDPGGLSFPSKRYEALSTTGSPIYGDRRLEGNKVQDLADLKKAVHQVILHTDLTSDSYMCFKVLVSRGLSTHFMIDWDGTIYQGLDPLYQAFHAGESNNGSIGVDLNNVMRNLVREPEATPYPEDHERIGEMSKKEYRRPKSGRMRINGAEVQAYGYTDAQYQALLSLLSTLTKVLDRIQPYPPLDEKGEIIASTLEDGVGFEGILGHFHVSASRWDPGPGMDWQRMYHGLAREHNAFPVELEKGLNIATLLEPDKVEQYAEQYYRNNEDHTGGGWFPVGMNQTWHGGVHLHQEAGSPVKAMFDGVVVAGRFGDKPTRMGHNNFVVLRHEVDIPTRRKDKSEKLVFYSLYMHLSPMSVTEVGDDSPEWVRALHRVHSGLTEEEEAALEGGFGEKEEPGAFEGGADEEESFFEEQAFEDEYDTRPYLEIGQHLAAFKRGDIALIPWRESPIRVSSGEIVGYVGQFGPEFEWEDLVHVEIFAVKGWEKAIDLGVHGRYFTELEGDLDGDLFIENRAILDLFGTSSYLMRKPSLVPERSVDPYDIEDLFTARDSYIEERRWLRKVISRHVSEWSDQVDWVRALSAAEDWDTRTRDFKDIIRQSGIFRDALKLVLPFVWLSRDVADHIGLLAGGTEWDGVVYHFHPIHFLMWLTYHSSQRIQVISRGLSLEEIKKRIKHEQKLREEGKLKESDACVAASIDFADIESTSAGEVLRDYFDDHDQGEWRILREEEI
ncbi:MAG: N-acetylmuramoyl-L-alanine amidase [Myxococcota bacterium]